MFLENPEIVNTLPSFTIIQSEAICLTFAWYTVTCYPETTDVCD